MFPFDAVGVEEEPAEDCGDIPERKKVTLKVVYAGQVRFNIWVVIMDHNLRTEGEMATYLFRLYTNVLSFPNTMCGFVYFQHGLHTISAIVILVRPRGKR